MNEKSNEIKPSELISQLELQGLIVTVDALNTQKAAVEAVVKKGADYVFPIKGNHAGLLEDIIYLFESAEKEQYLGIDAAHMETLEKNAGREKIANMHCSAQRDCRGLKNGQTVVV